MVDLLFQIPLFPVKVIFVLSVVNLKKKLVKGIFNLQTLFSFTSNIVFFFFRLERDFSFTIQIAMGRQLLTSLSPFFLFWFLSPLLLQSLSKEKRFRCFIIFSSLALVEARWDSYSHSLSCLSFETSHSFALFVVFYLFHRNFANSQLITHLWWQSEASGDSGSW